MKTYSAWIDDDGDPTFIEGSEPPSIPPPGRGGYRFLWICQAETWEEACGAFYSFMGWEPYKPF